MYNRLGSYKCLYPRRGKRNCWNSADPNICSQHSFPGEVEVRWDPGAHLPEPSHAHLSEPENADSSSSTLQNSRQKRTAKQQHHLRQQHLVLPSPHPVSVPSPHHQWQRGHWQASLTQWQSWAPWWWPVQEGTWSQQQEKQSQKEDPMYITSDFPPTPSPSYGTLPGVYSFNLRLAFLWYEL